MNRTRAIAVWSSAGLLALACWDCGGGGSGGGGGTPPPGTGTPPPSSQSACAVALSADAELAFVDPVNATPEATVKRENVRGRTKGDVRDALWANRARRARETSERRTAPVAPAATEDIGDLAVIEDDGSIGSAARLQSIVNMDRISKYPVSPTQKFLEPHAPRRHPALRPRNHD